MLRLSKYTRLPPKPPRRTINSSAHQLKNEGRDILKHYKREQKIHEKSVETLKTDLRPDSPVRPAFLKAHNFSNKNEIKDIVFGSDASEAKGLDDLVTRFQRQVIMTEDTQEVEAEKLSDRETLLKRMDESKDPAERNKMRIELSLMLMDTNEEELQIENQDDAARTQILQETLSHHSGYTALPLRGFQNIMQELIRQLKISLDVPSVAIEEGEIMPVVEYEEPTRDTAKVAGTRKRVKYLHKCRKLHLFEALCDDFYARYLDKIDDPAIRSTIELLNSPHLNALPYTAVVLSHQRWPQLYPHSSTTTLVQVPGMCDYVPHPLTSTVDERESLYNQQMNDLKLFLEPDKMRPKNTKENDKNLSYRWQEKGPVLTIPDASETKQLSCCFLPEVSAVLSLQVPAWSDMELSDFGHILEWANNQAVSYEQLEAQIETAYGANQIYGKGIRYFHGQLQFIYEQAIDFSGGRCAWVENASRHQPKDKIKGRWKIVFESKQTLVAFLNVVIDEHSLILGVDSYTPPEVNPRTGRYQDPNNMFHED